MNSIVPLVIISLGLCALCGCDYPPRPSHAEVERAEAERCLLAETAELRVCIAQLADGKIKLEKESLAPAEKAALAVRADIDVLTKASAAAMSEKDLKGVELPLENRLLHLMRNGEVNQLASRYLKMDFSRDSATFVELIRTARAEERRYSAAIKNTDSLYEQSIAESAKWLTATKEQREAEITRLKREISSLESSRKALLKDCENASRHKLQGSRQLDRERYERIAVLQHKVSDMDDEIDKKRKQVDYLRNPDANRRMESRAADEKQRIQDRANWQRDQSLRDIDRTMKPKRLVVDIVSEYEKNTVGALQKVMSDELVKHQKQIDESRAKIKKYEEARLLIPTSSKDELQRLRKTLQE